MNTSSKEIGQPEQEPISEQTADNKQVCPSIANAVLGEVSELKKWLEYKSKEAKKDAVDSMVGWSASDSTHIYDGKRKAFEEVLEKLETIPSCKMLWEPISEPVSFLEWASDEGYMRLSKEVGHKWFKVGKPESYTTTELYEVFIDDVNSEINKSLMEDYIKNREQTANNFGGL